MVRSLKKFQTKGDGGSRIILGDIVADILQVLDRWIRPDYFEFYEANSSSTSSWFLVRPWRAAFFPDLIPSRTSSSSRMSCKRVL